MNRKTLTIGLSALAVVALLGSAGSASAGLIYSESFDYGDSNVGFETGSQTNALGDWSSTSDVLQYDHDGGLAHPQMASETGGAMWLEFDQARSATDSSLNLELSTLSAGESIWLAAIFQFVTGSDDHIVEAIGGSVTSIGFMIKPDNRVIALASDDGKRTGFGFTGRTADGSGTYLMLLRATQGTTISPEDSTVDFWFDPGDASSVNALGDPDWTSGPDSKFGRHKQPLTGVLAQPSPQGRTDEIRIGTSLFDVTAVPEPASLTLLGLGGLACLRRRRA